MSIEAWAPPPGDVPLYDTLFSIADSGGGEVAGRAAVEFFSKSGLDRAILKQIWGEANLRNSPALSRSEFYIAMRLVSLAQAGIAPTRANILAHSATQLQPPRLEGIALPQPPPRSVAGIASGSGVAAWSISAADQSKYDAIFATEDSDHDGFISGAQGVALFSKSGLDKGALRHIWGLADLDKDSRLDREEFSVAMHLVVGASKRHQPIPDTLPAELLPPSKRHLVGMGKATPSSMPAGLSTPGYSAVPSAPTPSIPFSQPGVPPMGRPASGSMSLADALEVHLADVSSEDPMAAGSASVVSGIPKATTPMAMAVDHSFPQSARKSITGLPPIPVPTPASTPAYSNAGAPAPAASSPGMPPEIMSASKDLGSAMQSHLKRENVLLTDKRVMNEQLVAELKFLDNERIMLARQLESVRSQLSEEDQEFQRLNASIQAARAEVANLRTTEAQSRGAREASSSRNQTAKGILATLSAQLVQLTGRTESLSADVRRSLELAFGADLALLKVQSATAAVETFTNQHSDATADSNAESRELDVACKQLNARIATLESELGGYTKTLAHKSEQLRAALSQYESRLEALRAARDGHETSLRTNASKRDLHALASGKLCALNEAIAVLRLLDAQAAAGSTPLASPPSEPPAVMHIASGSYGADSISPASGARASHVPVPAPVAAVSPATSTTSQALSQEVAPVSAKSAASVTRQEEASASTPADQFNTSPVSPAPAAASASGFDMPLPSSSKSAHHDADFGDDFNSGFNAPEAPAATAFADDFDSGFAGFSAQPSSSPAAAFADDGFGSSFAPAPASASPAHIPTSATASSDAFGAGFDDFGFAPAPAASTGTATKSDWDF